MAAVTEEETAMTSVEEHASHIADLLEPALRVAQLTDDLPLLAALGRVTARPVLSPVDLPLFRNSQMDGFAVHSAAVADVPVRLPIVGDIPAGPATPPLLAPGTAMRIMTGAGVPEGADCAVPVEDVEVEPGGGADPLRDGTVTVLAGRAPGDFVRNRASDLAAGDQLLPAGQVLGPLGATIGHVAMQPGGPQATAGVDGTPVLCFPGNPVSTQVSFAIFARPLLLAAAGRDSGGPEDHPLAADLVSVAGKQQFFRGRLGANNPRANNPLLTNTVLTTRLSWCRAPAPTWSRRWPVRRCCSTFRRRSRRSEPATA